MQATFEYNQIRTALGMLEIEDIGNCAIRAVGIQTEEYYMVIRTNLGKSYIFNYGPIVPDLMTMPDYVGCSLTKIDYNEKRLIQLVDKWLNDSRKEIQEAEQVADTEIFDCCRDLIQYMREYRLD